MHILIEPTNHCTARCTTCLNSTMRRPKGFITPETFEVFLARLKTTSLPVESVQLNGQGEPLLHPDFGEMAHELKAQFPQLALHAITNGSMYKPIPEELDYLEVSVNAGRKESYERITGLSWEHTLKNIDAWRGDPKLRVHMLVFDENSEEVPEFERVFSGVHQTLSYKFDNQCGEIEDRTIETYRRPERIPCNYVTDMLFVTWDGTVLICPHDVHGTVPLGNIHDDSLDVIWGGEVHQRFLSAHQAKAFTAVCSNCNYNV